MRHSATKPESVRLTRILLKISQRFKVFGSVCCVLMIVACSDANVSDAQTNAKTAGLNIYGQFVDQARTRGASANSGQSASAPNQASAAFVHLGEPFEFWIFLAVLHDQSGNYYALQQRFAKLSVGVDLAEVSDSEWNYSDVVALDYQFDHLTIGRTDKHTLAQRAALGLSGADATASRVWVGAFDALNSATTPCQQSVQLTSPQLNLLFLAPMSRTPASDAPNSEQMSCNGAPTVERLAAFSVSRGSAVPVSGNYQLDEKNIDLTGYGWTTHGWGVPPDSSKAAVVFDRAWLLLDDQIELQAQRSRRASGQGPRITTGSISNLNTTSIKEVSNGGSLSIELTDAESKSVGNVPLSWQVESPSVALSLSLSPVSNQPTEASLPGQSWFGVVSVDGSHDGYGFVDYSLR